MDRTSEPDAKQWIFAMIESLPHDELTRCFVTLWAIWYARRKVIHEDIYQSPLSTHSFIENILHDLEILPQKEKARPPKIPMPAARWIPPPAGYVKINVDALLQNTPVLVPLPPSVRMSRADFWAHLPRSSPA